MLGGKFRLTVAGAAVGAPFDFTLLAELALFDGCEDDMAKIVAEMIQMARSADPAIPEP